jgi:hypothetical protein
MNARTEKKTLNLSSEILLRRFAKTTIKCDPFHFRHSGLDLQNSHINLGGQFLSFVPYSMSLSMIRALVSMSEREIAFFREYQGAVQTMKLTFNSHVYGRKVDFQIWGKIADLRQVNPDLNMVLMDFVVRRIANAYREIFIDMAMKDDRLRALYNDEELGLRRFDGDCVREIFGDNQTSLIPGPQTPGMFRITSLSLKRLRIYGPVPSELETLGLLLKIPFLSEYPPLVFNGTVVEDERSADSDDYRHLEIEIDFHPYLAEIMQPFLSGS